MSDAETTLRDTLRRQADRWLENNPSAREKIKPWHHELVLEYDPPRIRDVIGGGRVLMGHAFLGWTSNQALFLLPWVIESFDALVDL